MFNRFTIAAGGVLAALLVAAPIAAAQQQQSQAQRLSITQVDQRLSAQGFRVVEIEWDDGQYEVTAFNAQNQCRELDVDPGTAAIRRDRADDDCHDGDHRRNGAR